MAPPKPHKFFFHQPRAPKNTANFPAAITNLVFTGPQTQLLEPHHSVPGIFLPHTAQLSSLITRAAAVILVRNDIQEIAAQSVRLQTLHTYLAHTALLCSQLFPDLFSIFASVRSTFTMLEGLAINSER